MTANLKPYGLYQISGPFTISSGTLEELITVDFSGITQFICVASNTYIVDLYSSTGGNNVNFSYILKINGEDYAGQETITNNSTIVDLNEKDVLEFYIEYKGEPPVKTDLLINVQLCVCSL